MRADFSVSVKKTLQMQAAFICSNPTCRKLTIAPSHTDENKVQYIGTAAHITAASVDGPRYDRSLSEDERSSINNAIFLCRNCGDMIDKNNGIDYPTTQLQAWKAEHDSWVLNNLNQRIDAQNTINNLIASYNETTFNSTNVYNYAASPKDESIEHDKATFTDSNNLLNEKKLVNITGYLIDRATMYAYDQDEIEEFTRYFNRVENSFINEELDNHREALTKALSDLLAFTYLKFDTYPYKQTRDNYTIRLEPSLVRQMEFEIEYDPNANKKYQELYEELTNLVNEVKSKYKIYRRAIKTTLTV
jgi:hypothetical protein